MRLSTHLESYLEGKKHILKKQNSNFGFGKKKKDMVCKFFSLFEKSLFKNEVQSFIFKIYF